MAWFITDKTTKPTEAIEPVKIETQSWIQVFFHDRVNEIDPQEILGQISFLYIYISM